MYIHLYRNKQKTKKMKKTTSLFIALVLLVATANGQAKHDNEKKTAVKEKAQPTKWSNDASHSSIKFLVSHLTVSEVEGRFKTFNGSIESPTADFNNASINFTVDVTTITTEDDTRDKHLKSDDFFNADKYPQMTFKSTSFRKMKNNIYALEGNLTIRDVTKKVKFAVLYGGTVVDPWGNTKAGFKATGKISRKEYGLKWSKFTEAGGAVVGDAVNMQLNLEFAKQKS
jgi:polyisoprenoid-binding protein YceI